MMFLENLADSPKWYEIISVYWQWLIGFFLALGLLWRVTRKTTKLNRKNKRDF